MAAVCRIITSQMRESLRAAVVSMTRIATIAASMSIGSTSVHDLFASQLPEALNQLFTSNSDSPRHHQPESRLCRSRHGRHRYWANQQRY